MPEESIYQVDRLRGKYRAAVIILGIGYAGVIVALCIAVLGNNLTAIPAAVLFIFSLVVADEWTCKLDVRRQVYKLERDVSGW